MRTGAEHRSGSAILAILAGGLIAGAGDLVFAKMHYHAPFAAIGRSVAAGVLGRETAVTGGAGTAALGILLHCVIATGAAAVFVLASRKLPVLTRFPAPAGLVFGALVYLVMNWVVVPLSAIQVKQYPPAVDVSALVAHMVLVGLPIALATFWLGRRHSTG